MKALLILTISITILATGFFIGGFETASARNIAWSLPQDDVKMPGVVILGKGSKLGGVKFDHVSHNGGKYSITGTGSISCVECHHAAQPTSALEKLPPLKTAWPADRTTTLTQELFDKDAKGAGVVTCASCHAPAGEKPKLLDKIPEIKHESSTAIISLNNQQAMHRNCAGCHTEYKKNHPASKVPTAMQCAVCHKRGT